MSAADDWALAGAHAPRDRRAAFAALGALDAALGRVVATTSEPLIGQMRLTWWHERLVALDHGECPDEPVLQALHAVQRHDVTGARLAGLVEGWETLLDPLPLSDDSLEGYAHGRGTRLFALAAEILGGAPTGNVGSGWALADFARHCSDADTAARAKLAAGARLQTIGRSVPKPLRILATLARADVNSVGPSRSRWALLRAVL